VVCASAATEPIDTFSAETMDKSAVQQILEDANEVVKASKVGAELRTVAFEKAVDLLAGQTRVAGATTHDGGGSGDGGGGQVVGDKAAALAKKMHIDASKIPYVYEFEDDDVSVTVKRSALADGKAGATQELALLYAAARQAGGYDESHTKVAGIRNRVESMGVLDKSNFAAHLTDKTDWFTHKGKAANREFKVTSTGYEEAGKIVLKITGGQS
jgi:hypothetical protein